MTYNLTSEVTWIHPFTILYKIADVVWYTYYNKVLIVMGNGTLITTYDLGTIAISTTLSSLTSSSPNNQLKSHDGLYLDIHDIIGKLFIPHLNHVNRTFYLFVFHVGHLNANIYLLIILPLLFRSWESWCHVSFASLTTVLVAVG